MCDRCENKRPESMRCKACGQMPVIVETEPRTYDVDACIAPLVAALNDHGFETIASCCGHGHRPGNIALADGRELIIAPDFDTARKIDKLFPDIHGNEVEA